MTYNKDRDRAASVTEPIPVQRRRWGLSRGHAFLVVGFLAVYNVALILVDWLWACYPTDNDLDEVGWLVEHLSLSRPESLVNQGYPPGLPLVLFALRLLFGSLLRAAFAWQVLVITLGLFFLFRIALALFQSEMAAWLALVCGAAASLMVATSEFADGTSTMLLVAGVCALAVRAGDDWGFFLVGVGSGLAYLFRTHYQVFVALVPLAAMVSGFGARTAVRRSLVFIAGFAATAWPLWLLNQLAYGNPFNPGVSQYNIAHSMIPNALDWEDYAHTYYRWPLSRILRERPWHFFHHMLYNGRKTLGMKLSIAAMAMGAVAVLREKDRHRRHLIVFIGILALLYVLAVILPTRFTDRSYLPAAMLASLLVGGGLAQLHSRLPKPSAGATVAMIVALFVGFPVGLRNQLRGKRAELLYNRQVVDVLVRYGMTRSAEVFSNDWDIYNLADPKFDTFYNYGGWILLDSQYAAERPPPRASTLDEWKSFFATHGIRFAILKRRPDTEEIFTRTPPKWKRIFEDSRFTIFALEAH